MKPSLFLLQFDQVTDFVTVWGYSQGDVLLQKIAAVLK